MATAGDLINGALRLIGMLAEGETPSAETSQDALAAMNQMIDSWSTERLSVYATQDQTLTWPANYATRTLGPTGDLVGTRPIELLDSTYFLDPGSGLSFGLQFINQEQYNNIALKTAGSSYPQVMFVNETYPNVTLSVYPIPTTPLEFHFVSVQPLSQLATLNTNIEMPPGYLRAFRFNLATELAAEFGVEPSPQVSRIAMASKRTLKRINFANDVMAIPAALVLNSQRFNVYTGAY